jgi:hypothetical protein
MILRRHHRRKDTGKKGEAGVLLHARIVQRRDLVYTQTEVEVGRRSKNVGNEVVVTMEESQASK